MREKLTSLVFSQGTPHCENSNFHPRCEVSHMLKHPTELDPYTVKLPCWLDWKILSLAKMESYTVFSG